MYHVQYFADSVQCADGDLRLVSSSQETENVSEGRLEICYQGVWGAVHDERWSAIDAAVTCQELGFDPKGLYTYVLLCVAWWVSSLGFVCKN